MHFVNALALSGLETLKHLQIFFVNFTVVNALARALFLDWKHVELAKIRCFRCKTLKPFFSKQAQDSYYHGILAATALP